MSSHALITAADELLPILRESADDIELDRRLPDQLVDRLSEAGFFRLAVPKEYGGDEVDPLIVFEALEKIATADASTAWVILIISANPYLMGNAMHEVVWQTVFGDNPDRRTAGTLAPYGRAVAVDGGYKISGRWRYASGSEHCEYLMSGCLLFDHDKPQMGDDGHPVSRWFFHGVDDCRILTDSWDTTGLRGSGSHDYVIEDLFVPAEWSFVLGNTVHPLANPVYTFPTIPFCQLAGITLGLAAAAIAAVREMARTKRRGPIAMCDDPSVQGKLAEAEALRAAARAYVVAVTRDVLDTLADGRSLTEEQRASFRLACTHAVDSAVRAVDMMYKLAGGSAIYKGQPLEQIFRDAHTAGTHIQMNDLTYIKAGRLLLGLDPEDPLF